jgi:hypothetical protein
MLSTAQESYNFRVDNKYIFSITNKMEIVLEMFHYYMALLCYYNILPMFTRMSYREPDGYCLGHFRIYIYFSFQNKKILPMYDTSLLS